MLPCRRHGGLTDRFGGQAALFDHLGRFVQRLGFARGEAAGGRAWSLGFLASGEKRGEKKDDSISHGHSIAAQKLKKKGGTRPGIPPFFLFAS